MQTIAFHLHLFQSQKEDSKINFAHLLEIHENVFPFYSNILLNCEMAGLISWSSHLIFNFSVF